MKSNSPKSKKFLINANVKESFFSYGINRDRLLQLCSSEETQSHTKIRGLKRLTSWVAQDELKVFYQKHFYHDASEKTLNAYFGSLRSILEGGNPALLPPNKFVKNITAYLDLILHHFDIQQAA
jgi:hypothetical protein